MRKVAALALLVLTGPLWVLGLVLVPIYFIERASYWSCRRALLRFLAAMHGQAVKVDPLSSRDRYFASSRNARRAHKVVRP